MMIIAYLREDANCFWITRHEWIILMAMSEKRIEFLVLIVVGLRIQLVGGPQSLRLCGSDKSQITLK